MKNKWQEYLDKNSKLYNKGKRLLNNEKRK